TVRLLERGDGDAVGPARLGRLLGESHAHHEEAADLTVTAPFEQPLRRLVHGEDGGVQAGRAARACFALELVDEEAAGATAEVRRVDVAVAARRVGTLVERAERDGC